MKHTTPITPVGKLRDKIDQLNRIVRTDSHACVGHEEKQQNARIAENVRLSLIAMHCPRATEDDLERATKAIDSAEEYIVHVLYNTKLDDSTVH